MVIKDEIDIAVELTTHATAAQDTPAGADAEVVRRLRVAGAPILGKTTLPELATWADSSGRRNTGWLKGL